MKARTFAVAAGVSVPLILGGSVSGEFLGIKTVGKDNPYGLLVVNVYAVFDRPGEDHMLSVSGTPQSPLLIQLNFGVFYNHPFGGDTAPNPALVAAFPSLAYDSFVTIGKKDSTGDNTVITPGFPGVNGTQLLTNSSGWEVTPNDPQGNPFDAANSFPGNGQILIGQFSSTNGLGINGTMLIQFISNGVPGQAVVCFISPGGFCPCSGDCGGDNNGNVGIVDFLALLAEWGQIGTPCDLDGGGVGITDFLALLDNWGPCP